MPTGNQPPKQIYENELFQLGEDAKGRITNIILHWTNSSYDDIPSDYHLVIGKDGQVYQTCSTLISPKVVTPGRNKNCVNIALAGCFDNHLDIEAKKVHFGPNPPTPQQLNAMAWAVAILSTTIDFNIDFATVKTHGEVAILDHYGLGSDKDETEKCWDLLWIPGNISGKYHMGGPILREMARKRADKILHGKMHLEQIPLIV